MLSVSKHRDSHGNDERIGNYANWDNSALIDRGAGALSGRYICHAGHTLCVPEETGEGSYVLIPSLGVSAQRCSRTSR